MTAYVHRVYLVLVRGTVLLQVGAIAHSYVCTAVEQVFPSSSLLLSLPHAFLLYRLLFFAMHIEIRAGAAREREGGGSN